MRSAILIWNLHRNSIILLFNIHMYLLKNPFPIQILLTQYIDYLNQLCHKTDTRVTELGLGNT